MGKKPKRSYILRRRLMLIQLFSTLFPLLVLGTVSYYTIYSVQENRIDKGIYNNLNVEKIGIETMLNNLDTASKQLTFGDFGFNINQYINTSNLYDQTVIKQKIDKSIELVLFTNPKISTLFYYNPLSKKYIFEYYIKKDLDPLNFPVLATEGLNVTYYAPHESLNFIEDKPAFSVVRKLSSPTNPSSYVVYLEASSDLLYSNQYGYPVTYALLDASGKIQFSQDPKLLPMGITVPNNTADNKPVSFGKYDEFAQKSDQGWTILAMIRKSDVSKDILNWTTRFSAIVLLSLFMCFLLAWFVWRTLYRPLNRFKQEIQGITGSELIVKTERLGVVEFDDLLRQFGHMKARIAHLLLEVERKEKKKRHLEVEKLMHQINPHFLHNTLNTIQWLALMNGQHDIVKLVKVFVRVLNYNLAKEGNVVTIADEMAALQDYIELQQIRYNARFHIAIEVDDKALPVKAPRFLLQPLLENALYHAFEDNDGEISVQVLYNPDDHLLISVRDNGVGMTEARVAELLTYDVEESRKSGIGIGLNYVKQLIQAYYGEDYKLHIESEVGKGTTMIIRVPANLA